ncbi:alpha/beta-hydrolase [Chloropicon roscoffensis]|uniref:Alpha/beta-hydrolase n=1 Tax=Chloropicon roscoffensis TaxID=1461544 RepID=A0AAX4PGW5_9CHLO
MAKAGYETVGIDVYSAVQGESVYVDTSYGRVHVLVSGDTTKPACVTYHEVGVNSRTCFQGFFSASEPKKSLLLQSYCFYHFDYPGCEAEGGKEATAPSGAGAPVDGPTLEQASLQVGEAMKQLGIKGALGMGVGAGAYVLGKTSLAFPNLLSALVLFSPCCKKVTWWEYTYGKVLLNCLWYYGWSSRFAHRHLYERLFSSKIVESEGYGVPDLLYTFNQEVERIDPRAIARYLQAVLAREDVVEELKGLKTRVLLFSCMDSIYNKESLELNLKIDLTRADYIEVFDSGTLVTEQLPQVTLGPIDQFVKMLHQRGLCR